MRSYTDWSLSVWVHSYSIGALQHRYHHGRLIFPTLPPFILCVSLPSRGIHSPLFSRSEFCDAVSRTFSVSDIEVQLWFPVTITHLFASGMLCQLSTCYNSCQLKPELNAIELFIQINQRCSLAGAAKQQGQSMPEVSRVLYTSDINSLHKPTRPAGSLASAAKQQGRSMPAALRTYDVRNIARVFLWAKQELSLWAREECSIRALSNTPIKNQPAPQALWQAQRSKRLYWTHSLGFQPTARINQGRPCDRPCYRTFQSSD